MELPPARPLARGVPGPGLHLSRAQHPKSSSWPFTFSQVFWIRLWSSAVSMAAAGGDRQHGWQRQPWTCPLIAAGTSAQPYLIGERGPSHRWWGPGPEVAPRLPHLPHRSSPAPGGVLAAPRATAATGASRESLSLGLTAGASSRLLPLLPPGGIRGQSRTCPWCLVPPAPSTSSPSPRKDPHGLRAGAMDKPSQVWLSYCTRSSVSAAAPGREEPLLWVRGLPKGCPVTLVRPGLLPFFPPPCVFLPLPVNSRTSHRACGGR